MFVTVFIACLNLKTGVLTFANAGHNPPVIRRKGEKWEYLAAEHELVCAAFESVTYKNSEITLREGDALFLYTDGVTEAQNEDGELYGNPRLPETLNKLPENASAAELEAAVKADVDTFAENAEQADDITMLVLKYNGK